MAEIPEAANTDFTVASINSSGNCSDHWNQTFKLSEKNRNQMEILELKSTPEKDKQNPSVGVLYSRLERIEERVVKLEYRMMEIT